MGGEPGRARKFLTFVIIGAGPTGVELAGTIAELARDTLRDDFRNFDTRSARVVLAPDVMQKIFDPFFTTKRREGTGLAPAGR